MKPQYKIWIAESYSCQKDILQLLKNSHLSTSLTVFCSHRYVRPELELYADVFTQQPKVDESAQWLLEQCISNKIDLLFCGKHGHFIEQYRAEFEKNNIQLITGTLSVEQHQQINNKYQFSQICESLDLPFIPATLVNSVESLQNAIIDAQKQFENICAKPVYGVYGFGFVRLINDVSYFKNFTSPTICNTQQFLEAYAQLDVATEYLIMPYLNGQECSVDIACNAGKILAQVTRIKYDFYQECFLEHPCHTICADLVQHFQCDGLINIQLKQDQNGKWHILEINPRPAGGFAYTQHTGVNLVVELIADKLNLSLDKEIAILSHVKVLPITQSMKLDF